MFESGRIVFVFLFRTTNDESKIWRKNRTQNAKKATCFRDVVEFRRSAYTKRLFTFDFLEIMISLQYLRNKLLLRDLCCEKNVDSFMFAVSLLLLLKTTKKLINYFEIY